MTIKKTALGIEFGSTRIKSVLIDGQGKVLASGSFTWENSYKNGLWTYPMSLITEGLQASYAELKKEYEARFHTKLTRVDSIGISAMMHGYVVTDEKGDLLTDFRTWRNNNAAEAAEKLTELFKFQIPARWSIAHLYQAILNKEEHVKDIAYQTTLAGHVHWMLTGERVMGIGEASGMFPIDLQNNTYDGGMVELFNKIVQENGYAWRLENILPTVKLAGENAGCLTKEGSFLIDPTGDLESGIPFCPPEGDAGTGMVATNSVEIGTGNVSAGTSIFGMVVLPAYLNEVHPEIDIVTTPMGAPVAMVHCNNCTSEINAFMQLFREYNALLGKEISDGKLYELLFKHSMEGDPDCGGLISYNYLSGENITDVINGRPMLVRSTNSKFTLANLFRAQLYSTMATLKLGMDILFEKEGIECKKIYAHGGLFKTEKVCQSYLAAALNTPITVTETAGEGGAWGMAVLALYMTSGYTDLPEYLNRVIFSGQSEQTLNPQTETAQGFTAYAKRFKDGLPIERLASDILED